MVVVIFIELVNNVNCFCGYNNIMKVEICVSCGKDLFVVV